MKKILLIESCERRSENLSSSSIVHVRNSCIIRDSLKIDMISHMSEIETVINNKYDKIICAYSSPYMKYNAYLPILQNNPDAEMFWLVNDHDLEDNILLRKWLMWSNKKYHMICNNPREGYRGWILRKKINGGVLNDWIDKWYTINLNTLIFDADEFQKSKNVIKSDCIYYGTFRKHRIKDMLEYNGSKYFLSTSKKNQEKFKDAGVDALFVDRLDWGEEKEVSSLLSFFDCEPTKTSLRQYKYSLYFEDVHTHDNYAFMANRFYECLMANVLMFYDVRCADTVIKSGFIVDAYQFVSGSSDLNEKLKFVDADVREYNRLLSVQQSNFNLVMKERESVINEISRVFNASE